MSSIEPSFVIQVARPMRAADLLPLGGSRARSHFKARAGGEVVPGGAARLGLEMARTCGTLGRAGRLKLAKGGRLGWYVFRVNVGKRECW